MIVGEGKGLPWSWCFSLQATDPCIGGAHRGSGASHQYMELLCAVVLPVQAVPPLICETEAALCQPLVLEADCPDRTGHIQMGRPPLAPCARLLLHKRVASRCPVAVNSRGMATSNFASPSAAGVIHQPAGGHTLLILAHRWPFLTRCRNEHPIRRSYQVATNESKLALSKKTLPALLHVRFLGCGF